MTRHYIIRCSTKDCPHEAVYKIAASWSNGLTGELKTYALCCESCLPASFTAARRKQSACRLTPGETLAPPGIFRLSNAQRNRDLERPVERERELSQFPRWGVDRAPKGS